MVVTYHEGVYFVSSLLRPGWHCYTWPREVRESNLDLIPGVHLPISDINEEKREKCESETLKDLYTNSYINKTVAQTAVWEMHRSN